jgi:hypothetical protein
LRLPNAIVVESKSDVKLAREHVIAKLEIDKSNPAKAVVSRLDGKRLGTIGISEEKKPELKGKTHLQKENAKSVWNNANELKVAEDIGLLDGGLFLFRPRGEQETFSYPTYNPRIKSEKIKGYIYSIQDFQDWHKIDAGNQ